MLFFTLIGEVFTGALTLGEGKKLFYSNGVASEPNNALYAGESKANDVATIDKETKALEYTTDAKKWKEKVKEGTSKSGQTANLFMHTYNLAIKPKFDKKLKIVTDELSSTKNKLASMDKFAPGFKKLSSTKTVLQRSLKSLKFLSTKLAPALGVFGAVFTIVSGFFGGGEMEAVDLLRKEMHEGFKKIREEMNQKYLELKDYVDDSVQFAEVADLEAELEVINFQLLLTIPLPEIQSVCSTFIISSLKVFYSIGALLRSFLIKLQVSNH